MNRNVLPKNIKLCLSIYINILNSINKQNNLKTKTKYLIKLQFIMYKTVTAQIKVKTYKMKDKRKLKIHKIKRHNKNIKKKGS